VLLPVQTLLFLVFIVALFVGRVAEEIEERTETFGSWLERWSLQ